MRINILITIVIVNKKAEEFSMDVIFALYGRNTNINLYKFIYIMGEEETYSIPIYEDWVKTKWTIEGIVL
jgi:hypothetical protein